MSDSRTRFLPRSDVVLNRLEESNAETMLSWVTSSEIAKSIGLRSTPSIEKTLEWIVQTTSDPMIYAYAISWNNKYVGNVVLDRPDPWIFSSRLSIYIGEPEARGKGVGSTAIFRAAENYFSIRTSNKIWLTVNASNAAAIATYKRIGFQIEGTLREEFKLDGRLIDAHYMGLLRSDFERLQT